MEKREVGVALSQESIGPESTHRERLLRKTVLEFLDRRGSETCTENTEQKTKSASVAKRTAGKRPDTTVSSGRCAKTLSSVKKKDRGGKEEAGLTHSQERSAGVRSINLSKRKVSLTR